MAKGDLVEVTIRVGDGTAVNYRTEARQNGRIIEHEFEKEQGLTWLVVTEKTRGGTIVMRSRFLISEVLTVREEYG